MPITIRDVAKRLNLSITTVSRALDGYNDVAEQTRQLVLQTSQEMGYAPHRAARDLRRKRTDTIGYILPTSRPQFSDPFFSEFIAGIGDEAAAQKFDLLVSTAPPGSDEEKNIYQRWVQGRKVDGFILNRLLIKDWRVQFLSHYAVHYVCLERSHDQVEFIGIEVDSLTGIRKLVQHIVELGHRRIAYIGASKLYKIQEDRFAGYQAGLENAGIIFDPELVVEGDLTPTGGYQMAQKVLEIADRPTAIVCANDLTAIGAMHAVGEKGLAVGRDIAIGGFDGLADAAHTLPPLTTVNQPVYEIARQLAAMLLTIIQSQPIAQQHIVIEPELLIRASTTG
jgi:LacI family transcriptional regulator, galactose operon repressor